MVKSALIVGCLLCSLQVSTWAQGDTNRWQRVYTGEDSVIDVSASSLTFDDGHILRVRFRTTLSKSESLKDAPETKFKQRLEIIEFKLREKNESVEPEIVRRRRTPSTIHYLPIRYRFHEVVLLDSAGKVVRSNVTKASEDWKVLKDGGMMHRLLEASRQLPPFGDWKVIDYRFAEGTPPDAQEFKGLLGTRVRLSSDRAEVGAKVCSSPAYQSKPVTDREFAHDLGISLESIGVKAKQAETIVVKCEANGWAPPQSLLVKFPEGGMLMLWKGVFLVLKKERH